METIILVTVSSTLGVVALVTAIVVAFVKLNKKVDVNTFENSENAIYNEMDKRVTELKDDLEHHVNAIYHQMNQEDEDIKRLVDSRCDKLHTEITTSKQLLKG